MLVGLERDGYLDRVLLSMDIATTERYRGAGAPGYAGIITDFSPRLEAVGLSAAAIERLVFKNPWRFLLW
jgi:predicted metal-dependent phosphotriesterase family hydrolase